MTPPLVSIITPCYNVSRTLIRTIESVKAQSYNDWELLLIDDQSIDDTYEQARKYAESDSRIIVIRQEANGGAAKARNAGINAARGRYMAFLDGDDAWHPEKLDKQLRLMQKHNWPFSFTAYNKVDEDGTPITQVGVPTRTTYNSLLKTNVIGCSTAIYDTTQLGKVLMPDMRRRQDFGLWLRILKITPEGYGINVPLATYRVMKQSLSSGKAGNAKYNWHLYRHEEALGIIKSCYYFTHYAIRGILRNKFPKLAKVLKVLHTVD